jgi:hypothetical protein
MIGLVKGERENRRGPTMEATAAVGAIDQSVH